MLRFLLLVLAIFLAAQKSFSQKQEDDISFVKDAILKSYIPLRPKKDSLRLVKYTNLYFKEKPIDTFLYLSEFLISLNDGHLKLAYRNNYSRSDTAAFLKNFNSSISYLLDEKIQKDQYEGFWESKLDQCVIALIRNKNNRSGYAGYIVEANENIIPGIPVCNMYKKNQRGYLTKFTPPFSGSRTFFLISNFIGTDRMKTGTYATWLKIKNYNPGYPVYKKAQPINFTPSFQTINDNTCVFSLSSMSLYYAPIVDSILKANDKTIKRAKNFIIDIRDNSGGEGATYLPLLKYAYTGPIYRQSSLRYYSQTYLFYLRELLKSSIKRGDSILVKQRQTELQDAISKSDSFTIKNPPVFITDTILTLPQNVAVLINSSCVSAGELLVLALSQSSKTTLFGENTGGVVDYLSTFSITSPSKKYNLTIPFERRIGTPVKFQNLEGRGIKPHVKINESTPDWIQFVIDYYERKNK